MTKFISQEYIVSVLLQTKNINCVSFRTLFNFCSELQKEFNKNNIDAVVMGHSFKECVYKNSDFLELYEVNGEYYIKAKNRSINKYIFPDWKIYYLMLNKAKDF